MRLTDREARIHAGEDRETGVISRRGHALEGRSLAARIIDFPAVQGGVAAGWAFLALVHRGVAPAGVIFGRTNPVMIQGLVLAGISAMHRVAPDPFGVLTTDDYEQAEDRAGGAAGNKGYEAALDAVEMASLYRSLDLGEPPGDLGEPAT